MSLCVCLAQSIIQASFKHLEGILYVTWLPIEEQVFTLIDLLYVIT